MPIPQLPNDHRAAFRRVGLVLGLGALALLVLLASQFKEFDHDEHQFVASAALLVRGGSLPYVDYPYFHLPYLLVPYGLLFELTDHLLLAARAFSAVCSLIMLGLIGWYAARWFDGKEPRLRVSILVGTVILLAGSQSFTYTSGLAWNHDASLLLSVAATIVFLSRGSSLRTRFVAGGLLGLAIGTRISVLPLVAPFMAACFLLPEGDRSSKRRTLEFAALSAGLLLALVPVLILLAATPDRFMFDNYGYQALSLRYREARGYESAMSLPLKVGYLFRRVLVDPANLVSYVLLIFVLTRIGGRAILRNHDRTLSLLLALVVFSFVGALLPTPSFKQYFYAPLPFIVLAGIRGMALLRDREAWTTARRVFAAAVVICTLRGAVSYWTIFQPGSGQSMVTVHFHRLGRQVAQTIGDGRILTLVPIVPLEGGLEIYPEFATGPFAWRTAGLLTPAERERYGMISPAELEAVVRDRPPAGILLGLESPRLEQPLREFARSAGYRAVSLSGHLTLWLRSMGERAR